MCDFAILATVEDSAHIVAIELKSGVARVKDIEQLVKGLEVLHAYWFEGSADRLPVVPAACLVIGRRIHHFKRLLSKETKLRRCLKFGSEHVRLQILGCGQTLTLSSS